MKHFRKFMEEVDSSPQPESRIDAARQRFKGQKEKSREELEKTREKIKLSRNKSSTLKLLSIVRKKEEEK